MKTNNLKVLVSATMAIITALSGTAIALTIKKNSDYDGKEVSFANTTKSIVLTSKEELTEEYVETILSTTNLFKEETKIETTVEVNNEKTTITNNYIEEQEEYNQQFYNESKERLANVISNKKYSKDVSTLIYNVFDKIHYNYDSIYEVYSNYGKETKEEYINNFISTLENNISNIAIINESECEYYNDITGKKGLFFFEDGSILLNDKYSLEELEEVFLHELTHSQQEEIRKNILNIDDGIYSLLIEGEAFNTSMDISQNFKFYNKVNTDFNNITFCFKAPATTSNIFDAKYYNMLGRLAGFDVLKSLKDEYDTFALINSINSKYDINATALLDDINYICSNANEDVNSILEKASSVENLFITCLKQELNNINTQEETIAFLNSYRVYKSQYSLEAYQDYKDITNKTYGLDELENILLDKCVENSVLPSGIEKEVLDVILFNTGDKIVKNEAVSLNDVFYYQEGNTVYFLNKNTNKINKYNTENKQLCINNDYVDLSNFDSLIVNNYEKSKTTSM